VDDSRRKNSSWRKAIAQRKIFLQGERKKIQEESEVKSQKESEENQ